MKMGNARKGVSRELGRGHLVDLAAVIGGGSLVDGEVVDDLEDEKKSSSKFPGAKIEEIGAACGGWRGTSPRTGHKLWFSMAICSG